MYLIFLVGRCIFGKNSDLNVLILRTCSGEGKQNILYHILSIVLLKETLKTF